MKPRALTPSLIWVINVRCVSSCTENTTRSLHLLTFGASGEDSAKACPETQPRHKLTPTFRQREQFLRKPLPQNPRQPAIIREPRHNLLLDEEHRTLIQRQTSCWVFSFPTQAAFRKPDIKFRSPAFERNAFSRQRLIGCHNWRQCRDWVFLGPSPWRRATEAQAGQGVTCPRSRMATVGDAAGPGAQAFEPQGHVFFQLPQFFYSTWTSIMSSN